jgi:hypothetical protein
MTEKKQENRQNSKQEFAPLLLDLYLKYTDLIFTVHFSWVISGRLKSNSSINRYYFSCTGNEFQNCLSQGRNQFSLLFIQLHNFSQIFQTLSTVSVALRRDGHNLTTDIVTVTVLLDCKENWQQQTMTEGRFGLR